MLFERFFSTISRRLPPNALLNIDALAALNPDKIYVENVRSVLRVPHALAKTLCEMAVRQGAFRRFIAVECPDGSEAAEAEREQDLPETVQCYAEQNGFLEEITLPTNRLRRTTFYRLAR